MVSLKGVLKLAQTFYNRAVYAQQEQSQQYAIALAKKMQGLADGGAAATKHLLANPKYRHSPGLSALSQKFPEMSAALQAYNYEYPQITHDALKTALDSVGFYTQKNNAGTGYDPITAVSEEGYTAPSYYVDNLSQLNEKLFEYRPLNKDPLNESVQKQIDKSNKPNSVA